MKTSDSLMSKLVDILVSDLSGKDKGSIHEQLSEREFEVLRLIGSGKSVGEIAEVLNLAVTTISTYRARILEKLKLKNNAEIIQYCIREHLLTL